jgi:prolyl 4-hydroxylase
MSQRPDPSAERALRWANEGRAVEAANLLEKASKQGDAHAAITLAKWRVTGEHIRRDLNLARELFGVAAALGLREAEPVYTALLANGAGGSGRRWTEAGRRLEQRSRHDPKASAQLALLGAMNIDQHGDPTVDAPNEPVRSDPEIRRYPDFLTADECDYLIGQAQPVLQPSVVVHPVSQKFILDPIRTSTAAGFPFVREDPVMHAINRRIAAATCTTYEQGEPMQVLSYAPGQQYKLHSDALSGDVNQRAVTFLVYLNDDYEGGATVFPDVDLTVRGKRGEGLLFRNVTAEGYPHPLARHAGQPVTSGRKMLLSKWIRMSPLDLSGPPGRPL